VTLGELFPLLALRRRRSYCSRGWGGVERIEIGILRAIEHTAARQGRHDLMA
jgi:hypothetical protein